MGRRKNRLLVPGAREALDQLRNEVVAEKTRELDRPSSLKKSQTSSPVRRATQHQTPSTPASEVRMPRGRGESDVQEVPLPYPLSKRSKPSKGLDLSKEGVQAGRQGQPSNQMNRLAESLGIPYRPGENGDLKAKEAGALGGAIGGEMVKRLIAAAEQQLRAERVQNDHR